MTEFFAVLYMPSSICFDLLPCYLLVQSMCVLQLKVPLGWCASCAGLRALNRRNECECCGSDHDFELEHRDLVSVRILFYCAWVPFAVHTLPEFARDMRVTHDDPFLTLTFCWKFKFQTTLSKKWPASCVVSRPRLRLVKTCTSFSLLHLFYHYAQQ